MSNLMKDDSDIPLDKEDGSIGSTDGASDFSDAS
jgi:hypothetical protein